MPSFAVPTSKLWRSSTRPVTLRMVTESSTTITSGTLARLDRRGGRRDVARQRGLAAHQRRDVEDHDDAAVAHDRRAEDARHRSHLRADRLDHDFAVAEHLVDA